MKRLIFWFPLMLVAMSGFGQISGAGGGTQTVQTLPGNKYTGTLLDQLNVTRKMFYPPDIANLVIDINPAEQVFSDSAFTTPATTDGAQIQSVREQAGNSNDLIQSTQANAPLLKLTTNGINGLPVLKFTDNPSLLLSTSTNALTNAMSSSCTMYFVVSMTNHAGNPDIFFRPGGNNTWFGRNNWGCELNNGSTIGRTSIYGNTLAVACFAYDGTNCTVRVNNKEFTMPFSSTIWASNQVFNFGGYQAGGNSGLSSLSSFARCLVYQDAHTKTMRDQIVTQLMDAYGITQQRQIIVGGNSIDASYSSVGYTIPWTTQLSYLISPTLHVIENFAVVGQTTSQQASSFVANGLPFGSINGTVTGTLTGTPTTTSISASGVSWTPNQYAGKWVVMTSGTDAGMAALINSNSTSAITLNGYGLPATPSSGDTFQIMSGTPSGQVDIYIAHELTNDAKANGATDGPTAYSGNVAACPLFRRYQAWCQAARAAGFKVIAATYTDRSDGNVGYANFTADRLLINSYLTANWTTFADGFVDYSQDSRFATAVSGNTWWEDGIHPTNAGAKIIATYFANAIRSVTGQY